ncbi:MAG: flagellar hook protein FlgE [Acidobacteria bacterium]|nr:flagellar hook protein FlgE [Acidobacteriota bacterium]MBI3426992.1 flagellar hook protein FlgE [Acidobacteriota bacterium]
MALTFSTALSGLRANSEALGVTGNNIANANTTAYKAKSLNFADVFHDSLNAKLNGAGLAVQIGGGVQSAGTTTNFTQGSLDESGSTLNAGIRGNGYFVVSSKNGDTAYTRAGDLTLDRDGHLVNSTGDLVQGYQANNGAIPPGAPLNSLQVPLGQFASPVVTSKASFHMNLSSTDAVNAEFHAPVEVYDSLGVAHTMDLIYTKTGDGAYTVKATLDGNAAQVSIDGGAAAATGNLTFDSNGQLTAPNTLAIVPDQTKLAGATLPSLDIALYQLNEDGTKGQSLLTNYNATSAVAATEQNGFASGTLAGLSFSPKGDGVLIAVYSNGQTRTVGQVAIATFNSQEGLSRLGDNLYGQTVASGAPSIGAAGTGGRGEIIGGVLEQSNVDIANEFTDLIVAQRGFQANSRVITTINQTLQDVIQII